MKAFREVYMKYKLKPQEEKKNEWVLNDSDKWILHLWTDMEKL